MGQAAVLLVLGIGASLLAVGAIASFIRQVLCMRTENECQCKVYYDWVMRKGTEEQKKAAIRLIRANKLEDLRKLVGDGLLVDP